EQVLDLEAPGRGGFQPAQVDLRTEARMHRVAALHPHRGARACKLLHLRELLPDHAGDRAGAVAELQAKVVAAVAPLAALGLANQEDLVDLRSVDELVQEHALKVDGGADGTHASLA